jgi:hypothetical protein
MTVLLVDNALALKSMRSSDFDAYSAYGEVIDNSIQASARHIKVQVSYQPKSGRQFEPITQIVFVDDGHGMDSEVLHRCLQLGYSTRYNDRSGIGRFGVGMTLAAINQCKRVEVYSRTTSGKWKHVYIDLVEIEKTAGSDDVAGILAPEDAKIPADIEPLLPSGSGTVVVWSRYDNQQERASEMIKEMHKWVGRTFRKFIWEGVKISINGTTVYAVDPLYATTKLTKFPDDPPAENFSPIEFMYPIPNEDVKPGGPTESKITIVMSLLPVELRRVAGAGGSSDSKARFIHENEGISILRNGREVFYGHIPYWPGKAFEDVDRWWGCEISFDAVLDKVFMVKNIKRGAVPIPELKRLIAEEITPTRRTCVEKVQGVWTEEKAKRTIERETSSLDTGHSDAEEVASKTNTPRNQVDKDKDPAVEAKKLVDRLEADATARERSAWETKFMSQPFTIHDGQWKGTTFFDPNFLGGTAVIEYNMQHVFFEILNEIRRAVDDQENLEDNAHRIKTLIDLLLISFCKAEAMFDGGLELKSEDFVEQLRTNWGNYLQSYVKTWMKDQGYKNA